MLLFFLPSFFLHPSYLYLLFPHPLIIILHPSSSFLSVICSSPPSLSVFAASSSTYSILLPISPSHILPFSSSSIPRPLPHPFTTSSTTPQFSPPPPPPVDSSPATATKMPYRTDLKRPDLKGQFPCNVCGKIFCHSSSLSRHRMQAHFKSYTCTQCNQEIASSDTLRSHMYRCHQIQRMFMCRCCNWAFPDKTSLHIHMQSMQKSGMPGDVSVLARSSIDKEDLLMGSAGERGGDTLSQPSFGSPSNNSSPDEEQHHHSLAMGTNSSSLSSVSPMPTVEEQHHRRKKKKIKKEPTEVKTEVGQGQQQLPGNGGIFPPRGTPENNGNNVGQHQATAARHPNASTMEFLLAHFGGGKNNIKSEEAQNRHMPPTVPMQFPPQPPAPCSIPSSPFGAYPVPAPNGPAAMQQQWFTQWLANNPFFASALENCLNNGRGGGGGGAIGGGEQGQLNSQANGSQQARMLQALIGAMGNPRNGNGGAGPGQTTAAASGSTAMLQQPPQKKAKSAAGNKRSSGTGTPKSTATPVVADLSVHIPGPTFGTVEEAQTTTSPALSDSRRLSSLIDSLLQFKDNASCHQQNSPGEGSGGEGRAGSRMDGRNKRKSRVPTRATEMAEIVYGDELEEGEDQEEGEEEMEEMKAGGGGTVTATGGGTELGQALSDNVFPSIQRLMVAHQPPSASDHQLHPLGSSSLPQQPSPAVSDSQTSGSSNGGGGPHGGVVDPALISPTGNQSGYRDCAEECQESVAMDNTKTQQHKSKEDRMKRVVERITKVAEEVAKPRAREELMDCARQLQLMMGRG